MAVAPIVKRATPVAGNESAPLEGSMAVMLDTFTLLQHVQFCTLQVLLGGAAWSAS
jgi:hypothetical protein